MANNINWGKIYESTAWGSGVDNNTINWGEVYADLAGGGPKNTIAPAISGTAERGETLTSTTGTWTGTGTITYAYQWKRNGADISGATASTYVLVAADDNALMTCVVSATDTEGTKSATSNTLGPVLAAPLSLTDPVASGTAQVGQTLSTTDGTWQGIATITFAYQWRRDAVNISGATSSTYTLVAADYSTDVDCVVTATNSLGSASADSNDIVNIAGTAPVISGVPTISGTAQVLETLTASLASVSGVPTPTSALQWQISNDGVSGWSDIVGETSTTYTIALADDDKYIRVVQTSTNVEGSDTANSASTSQVAGSVPVISGVPTISSQTQVGETITATAASVSGVPTPTTSWQWQRSADGSTGWANISGATSSTYTLVLADDTNYVRAVQTETNALGSDSANSAASGQISDVPAFTGLLDTYSGAAAAYSLRQLSGSYSGDAIVVTTNGTNSQSIGFVNNELDTATLETFANGGNAYISQMYDQSGNGVDLFRSVFSRMPQIVSNGTTIVDSLTNKPTFIFQAGDVGLHTSGLAELSLSADWTISFVTKVPLSQTYGLVIGDAVGDAQDSFFIFGAQFRTELDGVNYGVYGSENRGVTRLWTHSRDTSNTININKDGASYGSVSSAVGAFDFVQIGSNLASNTAENFSELIIWGAKKSASDISGIETNINDFYTIY